VTLPHFAVGFNRAHIVRFLIDKGAKIGPDSHGRWPSILALECECDDEIIDMIEEADAKLAGYYLFGGPVTTKDIIPVTAIKTTKKTISIKSSVGRSGP
jgi:hypothetical protein